MISIIYLNKIKIKLNKKVKKKREQTNKDGPVF